VDLQRALTAVLASDYADFELVVVDQSTDDASAKVVAALDDPRIRYHRQDAVGVSLARNQTLELARGPIVCCTDDDCTPAADWISRTVQTFADHPDAAVIYGSFDAIEHDPARTLVPSWRPERFETVTAGRSSWPNVLGYGGNMALRLAPAREIGGFDPLLGTGCPFHAGEDPDIGVRLIRRGFAMVLDPESHVLHWGARAYADGSATRLMTDGWYSFGARYAKGLRLDSESGIGSVASLVAKESWAILRSAVRSRRVDGVRRLASFARGFWRGMRQPLDTTREVFVPRSS